MVRTILTVDRTASRMNRRNRPDRDAHVSIARGPGFTRENRVQRNVSVLMGERPNPTK